MRENGETISGAPALRVATRLVQAKQVLYTRGSMRRRTFAITGALLARRMFAGQDEKKRVYQVVEVNVLVKKMVADHLKDKSKHVTDGARFVEDLGLDSLDVVELMVNLEERFGLNFSDEELAPSRVRDAMEAIKKHLKEADRLR